MKLHVGSGPHYVDGWINMDLNSFEGWEKQPDVIGSVFDIPFEDNSMDKVYAGHILEHLSIFKAPDAVREMRRVLKPEGEICIVGPCMDKARTTNQPDWLLKEIPRGWDAEGMPEGFPHLWTATTELTRLVLIEGGLSNVREVPITQIKLPDWCNTAIATPPICGMWQCSFLANK